MDEINDVSWTRYISSFLKKEVCFRCILVGASGWSGCFDQVGKSSFQQLFLWPFFP